MELNITEFIKKETNLKDGNKLQEFTERELNILIYKALKEQLILSDVVSSKPDRKSLRQIIEERRTNLCLTASILKAGGKNETFFVGKYELLDNILNEFDGIDEPN